MSTKTIIAIADLLAMDIKAVKAEFKKIATGIESGYVNLGKLLARFWEITGSESGHYDAFRSCAADHTISNASYWARTYRALVLPGHLPDGAFDKVAQHRVCVAVMKILDGKAPVTLDAVAVAAILTGKDAVKDIQSVAECGLTVAEKTKADKAAKDAAAKAEAESKAAEEARAKASGEKPATGQVADDASDELDADPSEPPATITTAPTGDPLKAAKDAAIAKAAVTPAPSSVSTVPPPVATIPSAPATKPATAAPTAPAAKTTAKPTEAKSVLDRAIAALTELDKAVAELAVDPAAFKDALTAIHDRICATAGDIESALAPAPSKAAA